MALSLEGINLTKQRARAETRKPKIQALLKMLFSYLAQHKGNPDLQFVAFSALSTTSVVIADAAAKLFGVYIKKPAASTTAAFVKISDTAVTASTNAPEVLLEADAADEDFIVWPDGKSMATGITTISCTTAAGATTSAAADQPSGFFIIGG